MNSSSNHNSGRQRPSTRLIWCCAFTLLTMIHPSSMPWDFVVARSCGCAWATLIPAHFRWLPQPLPIRRQTFSIMIVRLVLALVLLATYYALGVNLGRESEIARIGSLTLAFFLGALILACAIVDDGDDTLHRIKRGITERVMKVVAKMAAIHGSPTPPVLVPQSIELSKAPR